MLLMMAVMMAMTAMKELCKKKQNKIYAGCPNEKNSVVRISCVSPNGKKVTPTTNKKDKNFQ